MTNYKYAVGDVISLGSRMINVPAGPFTITQRHQSDRGQYSYRVKCPGEPFDRVVEERQIEGLSRPLGSADAVFAVSR
jgi:hypothetical protein